MHTAIHYPKSRGQSGSVLLEALIAILIFSMGILAIVGMQTTAVKAASDAKYRSSASLLANELVGQMWVSDRTGATMQASFQGSAGAGGTAYTAWLANVTAALPGIAGAVNAPSVTVDPATGMVTIVLAWKLPSETAATPAHNFTMVAQVK